MDLMIEPTESFKSSITEKLNYLLFPLISALY